MPRQGIAVGNGRDKDKVQASEKIQGIWQPGKLQGAIVFNRVDLYVSGDFDIAGAAKALSIATVGTPFEGKVSEGVVYRLKNAPQSPAKYRYLVVSDNADAPVDVISIRDFHSVKEKLKKKVKKGTGLEVTVAAARKRDAVGVGKWFDDVKELHSFCQSSKCQLILSSGATCMNETVSGPSLDAILKNCGINPERHWREMNSWLESRLSRRVSI